MGRRPPAQDRHVAPWPIGKPSAHTNTPQTVLLLDWRKELDPEIERASDGAQKNLRGVSRNAIPSTDITRLTAFTIYKIGCFGRIK